MGVVDMSMPERWGVLQFADERVNETEKIPLPFWRARAVAMAVHNAQQAYSGGAQQSTGSATREWGYAATIKELLPHAPPRSLDAGCTGAITLKLYGNRTAPAGVCNTFAGSGGVTGHGPPSRSCPSYCAEVEVGDGKHAACMRSDRYLTIEKVGSCCPLPSPGLSCCGRACCEDPNTDARACCAHTP